MSTDLHIISFIILKQFHDFMNLQIFCLQIPDVPKPSQDVDSIEDWPAELRPSMRKLRQGMDSLCKTSKLTCSALRLRQTAEAVNLSHQIKYRRDVCFSQALTSLVTGLMNRLWCTAPSAAEADETFLKVHTLVFRYHSPHCLRIN